MTPRKPARKPSLPEKLAAWKQAYDVVLAEIAERTPIDQLGNAIAREKAAEVAAMLVAGADLNAD